MDNIIKSSINKIRNFVSSRINDQQGLIQRNPQTGVRSFNVKAVPQTFVQSVPAINIASFTANKINQALTSPNLFKGQKMSIAEGVQQLPKVGIGKLTTEFGEVLRGQRYATGEKIPENLQIVPKIPVLSGLTRVSSQLGEQIGKPVAQTAVGLGQIATKGKKQEGIKNIVLGAGGTALNILGPKFVNPTFLAANIGIGGVIGLGAKVYENITQKKPITQGLLEQTVTQGLLSGQRGIAMSPLLKFTQPAIEKIGTLAQTSKLFNRLSPVAKQQVLDRMIASVLNVGEGLIIDKSLGLTTDKTSVGIDAIVGALMGTRAVSGQNRAIREAFKDLNKRATDIFNVELKTVSQTPQKVRLRDLNKKLSLENTKKAINEVMTGKVEFNRLDNPENISKFLGQKAQSTDTIEIFRAGKNDIGSGEFVTISKERAQNYLKQRPGSKLYSKIVSLSDLVQNGGLKSEYIYAPKQNIKVETPAKSIEQLAEEATGFTPGLRQQFDTALITKNKDELQRLLPNVPQEYAQRFKTEIDNILTPKTIEPILKKDGTIEVKTNQLTVEMPKNMSTIADIFKNRKSELLSTFKTPDEIKLKYKGEKRIKVSGSETKNKLINAFKNQSPKTFDIEKADTVLNYVTNKINEKRLKQIITESGMNRLEKNSIKNFWNLVRKELSKNPAYKEDYEEIWKSLLDSEEYFNTKNEVVKPTKKLIPIKEDIEQLNNFPSKTQVYGKEAEVNYKNYVNQANNIIQRISNGLKFYKIGKKEFIRYIENPNTAPENIKEIIDYHNYLMDIAHASRENPMLGKIQSYYPHMSDESLTQRQDIKRLGDDLWISSTNMQLGTALKRLGLMKDYSLEYEKVMQNYFEQAAYEKYGSRIKFNEQTNNFVNKLETHLKRDSEGLLERPNNNFDYIDESSIRQNVETKKPIFARFLPTDTFDSLRRKIERDPNGKKLSYTMALVRDSDDQINNFIKEADGKDIQTQIKLYKRIDTKGRKIVKERDRLTTNELILLGNYEKKYRLQNFIDEVGKLDFEDNVKNYLNKEIDRLTKKGEYEQSLATQLSSFITGLAYRAQIWFNVNTALLQKSEVLRLPVLYSPQTIKQGAQQYINDLSTGRDILKQYDFNSITTDQTKFLGEENVIVNNKVGKLKQFGKNVDNIAGKFGNFLIDLSENSKNRDLLYTMEAQGKSLGLQGEDLYRFVRNEMFANSFILHEFNTPEIIRNPFFRILLQYMQYPIKMYSRAWELGTTNPNKVKGITQGAALIGTQGVAAILLAYITGKSLEKLNETFTDALTIRFGPIPTTLFNLVKSGKELYDNEVDRDKTEEQKQNSREYIQNQIKRYLISTGIPGSNQWRKTTGALSVINKGYDETFGGNITYPSPENKFDQIRGLLFGKTSFPENKEYYRATQNVTEFGGKKMQEAYSIGTNEFSREKAELIRELFKEGKKEEGRNLIELERRIQKARKESYDALTDIEKQALNSIPKQEPDDIQARMTKYRNMIQYPAIYDKKKFDALVAANGDLTKVDPLYTYNYEYVYKYMLYQSFGGSTLDNSNADELFNANPVILEISKARAEYYKNNPIEGLTQDSLRPLPSERAQALMNAKIWNDPEVQAYLQANKEYKNYIRGKLGLPTIEESEFLSGKARGKGGRRGKVKKVRFGKLKKIKLKKPKTFKIKKLKLPKIKAIEAPKTKVLTKKGRIKVKIPKLPKTIKTKVI